MLSLFIKHILINVFPWNKLKESISAWQIYLVTAQYTRLDDLIHLKLCLSYDTWRVTLYATPWPLSYDSVHKLNQQENGQIQFSYGRQPDILYCGWSLPQPICFLIRIQTFQVCTPLLYIPCYSNKIREN